LHKQGKLPAFLVGVSEVFQKGEKIVEEQQPDESIVSPEVQILNHSEKQILPQLPSSENVEQQCSSGLIICNDLCWPCSSEKKSYCTPEGLYCCSSELFCNNKCWSSCPDGQKFICPLANDPSCELETPDLLLDTDGDGIPDAEDTSPLGIGRYLYIIHQWYDYSGNYWDWGTRIPDDRFDFYKNKTRVPHGASYVTWDDPAIKEIAKEFLDMAKQKNLDRLGALFLATSFVQSLDYMEDFGVGYDEYPKYPVETLIERNGDCEDSSYLMCSLLWGMEQPCVLLKFPGHMAIGFRVTDSPPFDNSSFPVTYYYVDDIFGGSYYLYIETTAEGWLLGRAPDKYHDVIPEIVEIIH